MKKKRIIIILLSIFIIFIFFRQRNQNYYDLINAVSGATPLAVAKDVPEAMSLTVNGLVKQKYSFSSSALSGFASTRIRTKEFDDSGEFLGAYIYVGIPVFNILEGIEPQKSNDTEFKAPVDLLVKFTSVSNQTVYFSYNEIIMTDDSSPVTLAYYREPVWPSTERVRKNYTKNIFTSELAGLRLIAPGDSTEKRYLDNINQISLLTLPVPDNLLPTRQKNLNCTSSEISCIQNSIAHQGTFDNVKHSTANTWTMLGHGHGFEKTVDVSGYDLGSFLSRNFLNINSTDFFLFVSCDGYRCLFSCYEIFGTDQGSTMLIVDTMDKAPAKRGFRLAATSDFFADRSMWGLSAVVLVSTG